MRSADHEGGALEGSTAGRRTRARDLLLALSGALALVAKSRLAEFGGEVVQSYGGNFAASFAVFFVLKLPGIPGRFRPAVAAALALLATELFEVTNGFGVMSNTYDPGDYIANAVGVGLAVVVDGTIVMVSRNRPRKIGTRELRGRI